MRPEKLKGHLDLLLLAILAEGPIHGYAVMEQLRTRSGETFDLPEGTVYPALHRLQKSRLVTSAWDVVNGRRRRVYTLTDRGRAQLQREHATWNEFAGAIQSVLKGVSWPEPA